MRVLGRCPHATSSPCTSPLHVGEGTSSEGAHTHTPTQRHTSCSRVPESEFGVRLHWSTQVTWPCAPRRRANAAPSKPRRAGNKTTSSEPSSGMLCTAVRAVLRRKQVADARSAANSEMNAASNGIPVELYCVWQMRLCDHPYMWRVYQKKQYRATCTPTQPHTQRTTIGERKPDTFTGHTPWSAYRANSHQQAHPAKEG